MASLQQIIKFFKRLIRGSIEFFYCKRDGVQEGVEKLLNCWIYEIIVIVGLTSATLGIGFGKEWSIALFYFWLFPLCFTFLLNLSLILNYFGVIKRSTKEEQDLFFPNKISKLLKNNAFCGFFLPYGILVKTILYLHFLKLYKSNKLPWASPNDTRKERRKKWKEARIAKRMALEQSFKTKQSKEEVKKVPEKKDEKSKVT